MATTVKLTVTGMKCGGCEGTIKDKLNATAGVKSVEVSHSEDAVSVEFDETVTSEDDLMDVIEASGFTVED